MLAGLSLEADRFVKLLLLMIVKDALEHLLRRAVRRALKTNANAVYVLYTYKLMVSSQCRALINNGSSLAFIAVAAAALAAWEMTARLLSLQLYVRRRRAAVAAGAASMLNDVPRATMQRPLTVISPQQPTSPQIPDNPTTQQAESASLAETAGDATSAASPALTPASFAMTETMAIAVLHADMMAEYVVTHSQPPTRRCLL